MAEPPPVDDALATLNDELRGAVADDSPWLPLESNPEVFTSFAHAVGAPAGWEWIDVLGLAPELIDMVPHECAAVILLFPCTSAIYDVRRTERQTLARAGPTAVARSATHVKQVAEFGNACGTIASVHALLNGTSVFGGFAPSIDGSPPPLAAFRDETATATAETRGRTLLHSPRLKTTSDRSAQHVAAQTACPAREGPDLDHHFVAFCPVEHPENGEWHVVELDGTKDHPIDHGSVGRLVMGQQAADEEQVEKQQVVGQRAFLSAVADVIRRRFMDIEPESIEFSMMAFARVH